MNTKRINPMTRNRRTVLELLNADLPELGFFRPHSCSTLLMVLNAKFKAGELRHQPHRNTLLRTLQDLRNAGLIPDAPQTAKPDACNTYGDALSVARTDPDFGKRRVAVKQHPKILDVLIGELHSRDDIAALLGFKHRNALRQWLIGLGLLERFNEAYNTMTDSLFEIATCKEMVELGGSIPGWHLVDADYPQSPAELYRLAYNRDRGNQRKYTPDGEMKIVAKPRVLPVAKFTGSWNPCE